MIHLHWVAAVHIQLLGLWGHQTIIHSPGCRKFKAYYIWSCELIPSKEIWRTINTAQSVPFFPFKGTRKPQKILMSMKYKLVIVLMYSVQSGMFQIYPIGALTEQNCSCIYSFYKYLFRYWDVAASFVCQLGLVIVPNSSTEHWSQCCCEGIL